MRLRDIFYWRSHPSLAKETVPLLNLAAIGGHAA
jgi:hypothetical protein